MIIITLIGGQVQNRIFQEYLTTLAILNENASILLDEKLEIDWKVRPG